MVLIRRLRSIRSGVVITTRPSLNVLAADLARPGVAVIGWDHRDFTRRVPSVRRSIRRSYRKLDALVVLTEADRRRYEDFLGDATPVLAIPNSVPILPRGRSPLSEPVVIGAGRLTAQKGFDRLIRSFDEVSSAEPRWQLRIWGEGPRRNGLEAMIERRNLGASVQLPGHSPHIEREFERASIFALSSRSEGFPLVLIEAMSCGLPVVSFDCPTGPAEIIETGSTGLLVPPGDIDGFAQALITLIRDPEQRQRLGEAGAERVKQWDMARIGPLWEQSFDTCQNKNQNRSG